MNNKLKLTSRGRYAVMAMIELAQRNEKNPAPLVEVAERGNISLSYLEQLIAGLRRKGLVKSYRGPGGGYTMAKSASEITIPMILMAAEDSTPAKRNHAQQEKKGGKTSDCPYTDGLWSHVEEALYDALKDVTLQAVLDKRLK